MDFAGAPEESRARINDWVAEETGDKVRNLLQPGSIDPSTRLVLTNAIYFNASWHWPFDRRQTKMHPFHLEGGGSVDVPMMTETSKDCYGYAKGDGYQAVDVPYSWGEMSMTALKTSGWPCPRASFKASTQKSASRVLDNRHATTYRLCQSMMATR